MQDRRYEWDEEKNKKNLRKHGITLEAATAIFDDPCIYEYHDEKNSGYNKYGVWEDRYIAIGVVNKILFVVYTVREKDNVDIYKMISARKAGPMEVRKYEDWVRQFI